MAREALVHRDVKVGVLATLAIPERTPLAGVLRRHATVVFSQQVEGRLQSLRGMTARIVQCEPRT